MARYDDLCRLAEELQKRDIEKRMQFPEVE